MGELASDTIALLPPNIATTATMCASWKLWQNVESLSSDTEQQLPEIHIISGLRGSTVATLLCDLGQSVLDIKRTLWHPIRVPPVRQRLLFSGKLLTDASSVEECGVISGSSLQLVAL